MRSQAYLDLIGEHCSNCDNNCEVCNYYEDYVLKEVDEEKVSEK